MMKVRGQTADGRPALVFGLSFANLDRLRAGDPIEFDGREMGLDATVRIFAARSERIMAEMIRRDNPNVQQNVDQAGDGHAT